MSLNTVSQNMTTLSLSCSIVCLHGKEMVKTYCKTVLSLDKSENYKSEALFICVTVS